jgi:hypothetical protein
MTPNLIVLVLIIFQSDRQSFVVVSLTCISTNTLFVLFVCLQMMDFYKMMFVIGLFLNQISLALTIHSQLNDAETNLLYTHLNKFNDFHQFYAQLLASNGIDDMARLHHTITDDDIQQMNFEDKVNRTNSSTLLLYMIVSHV